MAGTDVYNSTSVVAANWSDTVGYTPAAGNTPASVVVGGIAGTDAVLAGTVSAAGNTVTATFTENGQAIQEQLSAVCDIIGGAVFQDAGGDYFLFSDSPLSQGSTYDAVSGFGYFNASQGGAACFAAGTCIETARGPVPVEALRPGDRVRALRRAARAGGFAPVIWTGHMAIACSRHPNPAEIWPVRVAADAFGPGRPQRALFLSPDHAVFVGDVLVPIRFLINDATIVQVPVPQVTYWHLELPAHDVILSEGLPSESYLDAGNRGAFVPAWPETVAKAPRKGANVVPIAAGAADGLGAKVRAAHACARLVHDDATLAPVRRRLREQARIAGWVETREAALHLLAGEQPLDTAWDGAVATATIPAGSTVLRLHSRSTVPCQLGEGSMDARRLGVAVTRLSIDGHDVRLDDARMRDGWHRMEQGWRWTDGEAAIPLTPLHRNRCVAIHTAPMLSYWQTPALTQPTLTQPALTQPARRAA